MKQIKIIQKKEKDKTDSIFYDGEIATFEKDNGTILSLIAVGEIDLRIDKDRYRNRQVNEAEREHKLTDKKLYKMLEDGKAEFELNNWFEVNYLKKGCSCWESDFGQVAHNYDDAIQLLKDYIQDEKY
jgi:hypothetical protein